MERRGEGEEEGDEMTDYDRPVVVSLWLAAIIVVVAAVGGWAFMWAMQMMRAQ